VLSLAGRIGGAGAGSPAAPGRRDCGRCDPGRRAGRGRARLAGRRCRAAAHRSAPAGPAAGAAGG